MFHYIFLAVGDNIRLPRDECKSVIKFETRLLLVDVASGLGEPAGHGGSCRAGTGPGAPLPLQPLWAGALLWNSQGRSYLLLSCVALRSLGLRWVRLLYFFRLAASRCPSFPGVSCAGALGLLWLHGERWAAGVAPLGRDRSGPCEEKPPLTGAGRGTSVTPTGIAVSLLGRCLAQVW